MIAQKLISLVDLPKCEAIIHTEESRRFRRYRGSEDYCCHNLARYKIGSAHYCGKHAGAVALDLLIRASTVASDQSSR